MPITILTDDIIDAFQSYLRSGEKSRFTIDKYIRDVSAFARFLDGRPLTKEHTLAYKSSLIDGGKFTDSSINSMLSSLRALFKFLGRSDCAVSSIRIQEMERRHSTIHHSVSRITKYL